MGAVFLTMAYAPSAYATFWCPDGGVAPGATDLDYSHYASAYNRGNISLASYRKYAPVRGVSLDQAATFLTDMKDVRGAYFDDATNRIVFVGLKNTASPVFNKDDLAVAVRSLVFNNSVPQVSIGNGMQNPQPVYYYGGIENTNMGYVLEAADYQLKRYLMGMTPTNVPGYSSLGSRLVSKGGFANPNSTSMSRYWISPKEMKLKQDSNSGAFVFEQATMQVQTEPLQVNDPNWNQVSTEFVQHFTAYYDTYAQENSLYERTRELAKLTSVVKWLKDNNIATDYEWARNYTPAHVSTPTTEPWLNSQTYAVNNYTFHLSGGVSFDIPNSYVADNGQASGLKADSQAAAPNAESAHWDFTSSGQQHTAVSVSADAFRSVGGYSTQATDMSLPSQGEHDLKFSRNYSSFSTAQTGIGRGWQWVPAGLRSTQPWNNVPCSPAGGYSGNYPVKLSYDTLDGVHETFTYNCGSGSYVPDKAEYHTRLVRNTDGSFSAYAKDGSYFKFSIGMALIIHRDRNNNGIYFEYDGGYNITRIYDDYNRQINLNRNGAGMITSVTDWAGRSVAYGYDGSGNLTTVTDPRGNVIRYYYDSAGRMTSASDRQNRNLFTNTYTSEGKVATSVLPSGTSVTYAYNTDARTVTATDNNARTTKTYYDDKARPTQVTDQLGFNIYYTYGVEPLPLTATDKRGHTTTFAYDSNGNMTSATYPNNKQITYTYDSNNHVTQVSDGRYGSSPKITSFTYDAAGNVLTKTEAGITVTTTYDDSGQPETATDGRGNTAVFEYDFAGNRTREENGTGAATTYAYDTLGRLTQTTDAAGKTKGYTYDNNNNVLTAVDAAGTTVNQYDADNQLTQMTLPDGQSTQFGYNVAGSQTSTTDPATNLTSYGYDQYQNMVSRQDALTHTTQYAYDKLGRKTEETTPLGKVAKWEYDGNGNLTKRIDESNRNTLYEYDNMNRLTKATYPDSSIVTFGYDDRGNMTQMVDPNGTTTFSYDNFDRLIGETDSNNATLGYQYDNNGNMTRITYPDSKQVNYTYDAANRLKTITDWNSAQTSYRYNANGTLNSKQLPNGIQAQFSYDNANRLTGVQYLKDQQLMKKYAYTRNGNGNVTKETESTPATPTSYVVYDEALRTGWSKNWSWDSTVGLADTTAPYAGTKAMSWKVDGAWGGAHIRSTAGMVNVGSYNTLSFAMKAASGTNHAMAVNLKDANDNPLSAESVEIGLYGGYPNASGYKVYNIPLSAFGSNITQISGLQFEDMTGAAQPKVLIDDLKFTTATATPVTIFSEALAPTAMDWSWGITPSFNETLAFAGAKAMGVVFNDPWGGLGLQTETGLVTTAYDSVNFALKGSQAGQSFTMQLTDVEGDGIGQQLAITPYGGRPDATSYTSYSIPLSDLGLASNKVYGLVLQEDTGAAQPKVYVDELQFIPKIAGPTTDTDTTFGYDSLGRVTSASYPGRSYTYTYDAVGNRLTSNENGTAKSYTYNNDNQLTAQGSRTFTYDNQGNEITDGAKTLTYDYDDRLKTYTDPGASQSAGFTYDGVGNRIKKSVNGTPAYQYVNDLSGDLSKVLVTKNVTNSTSSFYVYGAGMVSQGGAAGNTRQYYLDDGLGNVRYVTDSAGATLQAYTYDPYGNPVAGTNLSNYTYQGQQKDYETGLTYLRARYYDPTTGRFISKDPVPGTLNSPQGQNGYSYAHNDPVNQTDPSGMFLDVIWDVGNMIYDVGTCDWVSLGADAGAALIPFVPGGTTKVPKLLKLFGKADNLSPKDVSKMIGNGHSWNKHKGEFPEIKSADQFARHIEDVMRNPDAVRNLDGGRIGYWDNSGTVVIFDPKNTKDAGTAFRPPDGRHYFDRILH
jgi:RHS repeat-associated protein